MCKEMPVIPVNRVVDPKRIIGKKAEEEQTHKGSLTPPPTKKKLYNNTVHNNHNSTYVWLIQIELKL
jgi:hypothetical protein